MILAQEPKLQEFKPTMKHHIALALNIDQTQVNIKAGTNEGLGYIGAQEAIAAYAVVLLKANANQGTWL
jgi:2-C-methyl-D-erythritol 2,4-cyclodiphosphate synthase